MIKTPLSIALGGAFWTPGATILGSSSQNLTQLIKSLFGLGEQGFAYDLNDLSTLYQDAAGTIPVTTAGQPVGLMLDKSKGLGLGGNVYASSVIGYFDSGSTNENLSTVAGSETTAWMSVNPDTFYKLESNGGIADRCRIQVKNASGVISYLTSFSSDGVVPYPRYAKTNSDSMQMRIYFKSSSGNATGLMVRQLTGNHAYQTVSASRPILQRNATTGAYYLAFDGVDDFLQTNNIDFTATDKVSLFAGVRKLSDAAPSVLVELSASIANVGTFNIQAPRTGNSYSVGVRGSILNAVDYSTYTAPISNVISLKLTTSSTNYLGAIMGRFDGVNTAGSANSSAASIGNYGNYPLYIGRRGGTLLPFNGHIYGLIGIGRLTTDSETTAIEKELAKRVGATLNV